MAQATITPAATAAAVTAAARRRARLSADPRVNILVVLTATTGIVDAISFLHYGRVFTANITGNILLLCFAATGTKDLSVHRSLLALAGFFLGAFAAGRLAAALSAKYPHRWLAVASAIEGCFLLIAAATVLGVDPMESGSRIPVAIVVTGFAMGLRNGTVRRMGVPDLPTTAVTMTLTGLIADSRPAGGANTRAARRIFAVCAFAAGVVIGALLFDWSASVPLFATSLVAFGVAAIYATHPRIGAGH